MFSIPIIKAGIISLIPLSIIIYDSNFQFLGETKLAEEYNLSANNFIITKEGLLIRKETNNEDEIKDFVFKLKEK